MEEAAQKVVEQRKYRHNNATHIHFTCKCICFVTRTCEGDIVLILIVALMMIFFYILVHVRTSYCFIIGVLFNLKLSRKSVIMLFCDVLLLSGINSLSLPLKALGLVFHLWLAIV